MFRFGNKGDLQDEGATKKCEITLDFIAMSRRLCAQEEDRICLLGMSDQSFDPEGVTHNDNL